MVGKVNIRRGGMGLSPFIQHAKITLAHNDVWKTISGAGFFSFLSLTIFLNSCADDSIFRKKNSGKHIFFKIITQFALAGGRKFEEFSTLSFFQKSKKISLTYLLVGVLKDVQIFLSFWKLGIPNQVKKPRKCARYFVHKVC